MSTTLPLQRALCPLIGGSGRDCTKRFSSSTYLLLRPALFPADRLCFPKNCSSPLPPSMLVTSGPRPINCKAPRDRLFEFEAPSTSFTVEDFKFRSTETIVVHRYALFISLCLLVTLIVFLGALIALLLYLGKGTHNLVVYSGDTILLSIASLNSVRTGVTLVSILSLIISVEIFGRLVLLRLFEANNRRIYRLTKQALGQFE